MNPAILISNSGRISAVLGGNSYTVETDHPNYNRILDAVRNSAWESFKALVDVAASVRSFIGTGKVALVNGAVTFNGETLHNSITDRILNLMNKQLPFEPMVKFLENLMQNPSKRAVDELYGFLEFGNLPITADGHFLAFKNVRKDWKDIHSGTFDNSVGKVCEMPRNKVDEDKDRTCSYGLHFCSQEYLPKFNHADGHTVIVKINPRDVVAIPSDYNNTKGRCARYEVVAELAGEPSDYVGRDVVTDFDFEYNEDYDAGWEDGIQGNAPVDSSEGYLNGYEDGSDSVALVQPKEDGGCGKCQTKSIYGFKPSGDKFYNVHGKDGRFTAL